MSDDRPTQESDELYPEPFATGTFNILGANQIQGKVKFVGGNAIGPKVTIELLNVVFRPANAAMGVIQDEWGQLQVTGECLADTTPGPTLGIFGTIIHPDTTLVSPLTDLYYVGKGVVSIELVLPAAVPYREVGNCPVFEFTPNITVLTHYSSMVGVRTKDLEVVHEKQATINMRLDEWSYENMRLAFMGA